jgi:hypothetical protein
MVMKPAAAQGRIEGGLKPSARLTAICSLEGQPEMGIQGETTLADVVSGRNESLYYRGMDFGGYTTLRDCGDNLQIARSRRQVFKG